MTRKIWKPYSYETLLAAYEREAKDFGAIAESQLFETLLPVFADFQTYLKERWRTFNTRKFIKAVSRGSNVLDVSDADPRLREILACAHMASCCWLFDGWQVPAQAVNEESMRIYARRAVEPFRNCGPVSGPAGENMSESEQRMRIVVDKIQNSDALRSITILKLLGLFKLPSENCLQLSLAAGNARRDMSGLHTTPVIEANRPTLTHEGGSMIGFGYSVTPAAEVVLIDNDPSYFDYYESLNNNRDTRSLGLLDDMDRALTALPGMLASRDMKPRNLIAGLRIDHRMFTDIERFFLQLVPVMADTAELALTIGAGNDIEEYAGRVQVFDEMFEFLKKRGLQPVRIKLHAQGSAEQQRSQPAFGLMTYTSYEILYCKLMKKKLSVRR